MNKSVALLLSVFFLLGACALNKDSAQNRKMIKEIKELEYQVKETERGVEIVFPAVLLFDFDSDRLKPEAKVKMHIIAGLVNDPAVESRTIAVEGHADILGPDAYNMDISKRRSESVGRSLVFSGVRKERLATKWFGDTKPVAENTNPDGSDNPAGRSLNRRVELIIENSRFGN